MAINFSASFAACLAAGLKVPRQIMYCISQGKCASLYMCFLLTVFSVGTWKMHYINSDKTRILKMRLVFY